MRRLFRQRQVIGEAAAAHPSAVSPSMGGYDRRSDHLFFSSRVPDQFPDLDYEVPSPDAIPWLFALVDSFVRRYQWNLSPVGLVYRTGAFIQTEIALEILRRLRSDHSSRLTTPWLSRTRLRPPFDTLVGDLRLVEDVRNTLAGDPLVGPPNDELFVVAQDVFHRYSPLSLQPMPRYGRPLYTDEGQLVLEVDTSAVFDRHAIAYAAELLRSASSPAMRSAVDEYVRKARPEFWPSVQDLQLGAVDGPPDYRSVLRLCEWAIANPLTELNGLPSQGLLDCSLPFLRYILALGRLDEVRKSVREREPHRPHSAGDLLEAALLLEGAWRPVLFDLPTQLDGVVAAARTIQRSWLEKRLDGLGFADPLDTLSQLLALKMAQTADRYLTSLIGAGMGAYIFEPSQERFGWLARLCDQSVIVYRENDIDVFLCDAADTDDVQFQGKLFELGRATQALIRTHVRPSPPPGHRGLDAWTLLEWAEVSPTQVA